MRIWGPKSSRVYRQLHPQVQQVCDFILQEVADVSLITGHRTEAEQNALYPAFTKVKWPNSQHNHYPSLAVDLQPYPYPDHEGELREQLTYIAGRVVQWGIHEGINVRWGGDWDRDGDITDNKFDDLFHFEVRL